jgi:hypothetical protein
LRRPATPAAASRWPTFVFTEPRAQKPRRFVVRRNAFVSAATSAGSPSAVPVPWASTMPIVSGSTPAADSASTTTPACPATPGAVKLALSAPSLFTAVPRITARIRAPSSRASRRRRRTTTPTPLPNTVPAALASNARQCPSGETMLPSWKR